MTRWTSTFVPRTVSTGRPRRTVGRGGRGSLAAVLLIAVYAAAAAAGFLAPYDPVEQNRRLPFAPPARLHFIDQSGRFHVRPFVYATVPRPGTFDVYDEDLTQPFPIRLFVTGATSEANGADRTRWHLFGVDPPARVFLMGSDEYGRDVFSRLVHGARISLAAGLLAAGVAVAIGLVAGAIAGFYGGVSDAILMRSSELVMAIPWLYLLLAIRAALPLHVEPADAFLLLVIVVGVVGWARPARLVRAVVLSARTRDYVVAARSCGASDLHLLWRHVLPQAAGVALTQLAVLIPQCILAEVTLSFFGLGIAEPVPSWGNMLVSLQRYYVVASYWWMFLPGIALIAVFLLYYAVTDALHQRLALRSP
jgi:peptide/nickel transport system permease protein